MDKSKIVKIATIIGSILLVIMAIFHISGIGYVNNLVQQSNTEPIVKTIFPVLFAHPSVQLFGFAGLGIWTLFSGNGIKNSLLFIAVMVCIDAAFAFYLGAAVPGVLLMFAAFTFGIGAVKAK